MSLTATVAISAKLPTKQNDMKRLDAHKLNTTARALMHRDHRTLTHVFSKQRGRKSTLSRSAKVLSLVESCSALNLMFLQGTVATVPLRRSFQPFAREMKAPTSETELSIQANGMERLSNPQWNCRIPIKVFWSHEGVTSFCALLLLRLEKVILFSTSS